MVLTETKMALGVKLDAKFSPRGRTLDLQVRLP